MNSLIDKLESEKARLELSQRNRLNSKDKDYIAGKIAMLEYVLYQLRSMSSDIPDVIMS